VIAAAQTHVPDGVRLELEPVGEDVPPVAADEAQLRQVLDNLLDNAIKYSPAGGDVHLGVGAAGAAVRFSVADAGLGIPAAEQDRIFEKFYRLDPNMTGGIGGTGLGLFIARELVRRVGGRIWVEPNGGQGSVFYVEIPAAAPLEVTQTGEKAAVRR
jgi:signal transduction histidine kinase